MNRSFHTAFSIALLAAAVTPSIYAQSLTPNPGYGATKLFDSTPDFTITGLGASPSGDVYYIETDSGFSLNSTLYKRSAADGYTAATPLFDLGPGIFGSFVAFHNGLVYFGESSTNTIRSIHPDGTGVDDLGLVVGNYDIEFAGSSIYLSHNPGPGAKNRVSKFELAADGSGGFQLSAADLIVDTPADFSGPIAFGPGGSLFYGGSGSTATPNLFRFDAAEVAAAFDAGPTLSLDAPHQFLANGSNGYLAFDTDLGSLWQSVFNSNNLNLINASTGAEVTAATTSDSIGNLDLVNGTMYTNVTKSTFDRSAVYAVVPEPATIGLMAFASLLVCRRNRR